MNKMCHKKIYVLLQVVQKMFGWQSNGYANEKSFIVYTCTGIHGIV